MKLPDKIYNVLKWIVIIALPAGATLYAALAPVWGWGYADAIVKTVTAVDTFLGAILCISTVQYNAKSKEGRE